MSVGSTIKRLRREKNITQEQLAEKTGLSQKHLSRVESGYHNSSFLVIANIAKVLNVPIDAFVENTENIYENSNSALINTISAQLGTLTGNQLEIIKENIDTLKKYTD